MCCWILVPLFSSNEWSPNPPFPPTRRFWWSCLSFSFTLNFVQNMAKFPQSETSTKVNFIIYHHITRPSLHAAFVNQTILRFPNCGHFWKCLKYLPLWVKWIFNLFSLLVCRHPWRRSWPLWVSPIHTLYVVLNPMKRRYGIIIASSFIKCSEALLCSVGEKRETRSAVLDG